MGSVSRGPGAVRVADGMLEINADRAPDQRRTLVVLNTGDRPVQIGAHYHFFETNKALVFDRAEAYGMHLDLPSGTSVRFEPGEVKEVRLVPYSGDRTVYGFNALVEGRLDDPYIRTISIRRCQERGFGGPPTKAGARQAATHPKSHKNKGDRA